MISKLNFSNIFNEQQLQCVNKYKRKNGKIKKFDYQSRFLSLYNFVSNSVYWTRFNVDAETKKVINPNYVNGKYLNEIFTFYNENHLFDKTYKIILTEYFQLTNFESLKTLYLDSSFAHNVIGLDADRNPQFYNKTGYKFHTISDSHKNLIAIIMTKSSVHDSEVAEKLINNLLIDKSVLQQHTKTIIADAAYSNYFVNIKAFTDLGLKVIFGMNKRVIKKGTIIHDTTESSITDYKTRHIVENLIADIKRYPILLNCYEKSTNSYRGLLLFVLSAIVCKRYNKIVDCRNDEQHKKQLDDERIKRKEKGKLVRLEKIKQREKLAELNAIKKKEKQERQEKLKKEIDDKIWELIDKRVIRNKYNCRIKQYNTRIKQQNNTKRGRPRNISYEKFNDTIGEQFTNHVRNNELIKTSKHTTFYKKDVFIIEAEPYAFSDQSIQAKMISIDIVSLLNKFINDFFT